MGSKQRFTFIFVLISLTMTMLFFQNCSPTGGLYEGDSVTDPFIIDPPVVFASKNSNCSGISTTFTSTEQLYICIEQAGIAPIYCHTFSTSQTCDRVTVTAPTWTSMSSGNWKKVFSTAVSSGGFSPGTYTAYVIHTDDPNAISNTTFTVTP